MLAFLTAIATAGPMLWAHRPCPPAATSSVRGVTTVEDGHLAAIRFAPRQGGTFDQVGVKLFHDPTDIEADCRADLAGEVQIAVSSGEAPPADWVPRFTLPYDAVPVEGDERLVRIDLPEPLVLDPGQVAWIAVRMRAGSVEATCVRTCMRYGRPRTNFWSHGRTPPFAWAPFDDVPSLGASTVMSIGLRPVDGE